MRRSTRAAAALFLTASARISIPAAPLRAADGDLDLTFSADGKATVLWDEDGDAYNEATAVAPLGDGSVVVGGTLTWVPTTGGIHSDWILAKLTRTGIVDSGWGDSGRRRLAFAKAIAACAIACSLCARSVGNSLRWAASASPKPATLPCPKMANTP